MIKAKDIRKGSRISYRNFGKSETGIIAEIDLEGEDGKSFVVLSIGRKVFFDHIEKVIIH